MRTYFNSTETDIYCLLDTHPPPLALACSPGSKHCMVVKYLRAHINNRKNISLSMGEKKKKHQSVHGIYNLILLSMLSQLTS